MLETSDLITIEIVLLVSEPLERMIVIDGTIRLALLE
jgi:hypothetical protein